MSRKLVVGNWKMNLSLAEGIALAKEVSALLAIGAKQGVKVVLATPFTHLASIAQAVDGELAIGAQDCSAHKKGPYTGEVSAEMIASTAAKYVILGHSERREYHAEKNTLLAQKVSQALEQGLKVIYCCGEVLSQREANKQFEEVGEQLLEGLFHLTKEQMQEVVIAYEPVWAIGTGVTASADQAQEIHAFIRELLKKQYGESIAENTSILYGGSCKPGNAKELFAQADVDGGLIGGAALKACDFVAITQSFE